VAIVQVSQITNRKGLQENLPQLAGAELGWAVDSRRLFIGNGTLEEGAPVIGNTEILTEFSDIVATSPYTYSDSVVGYSAQTGPTPSDPVVRTVQQKLDDFASVRDFGATGDGSTDDTAAINRALYQLYCRETNTQVRRTLYFPAGTYVVTETIIIPAYAKLVGEGADCTIIQLAESVDISSLTAYVARFGDSLQQTGVNIGNNGATAPRNIEISSMTFQSLVITDVFLVQDATQCYFDSVNFVGPFTSSDITDPGFSPAGADDIAGVRFASTTTLVCTQITFDKCAFTNLAYGVNTDQYIRGITVSNSKFDTLWQGVVLGTGATVNGGPTGFRTVQNIFDVIYAEGIVYDAVSINASAYNVFYNVGYSIAAGTPTYSIIRFGKDTNISVGDLFERSAPDNFIKPRISISYTAGAYGGTQLQLGRLSVQNGLTYTILDGLTQLILTTNNDDVKAFKMYYTITRENTVRTGTLTVVSGPDDSTGSTAYDDNYIENNPTGVTMFVNQSGSETQVKCTASTLGSNGILTYSISSLA
jgi:hypothetical protein